MVLLLFHSPINSVISPLARQSLHINSKGCARDVPPRRYSGAATHHFMLAQRRAKAAAFSIIDFYNIPLYNHHHAKDKDYSHGWAGM
ncbi:MAG: hypothetical protein ACUZ77_10680 [Candidatus Brocadiales bacterium]